jgi:hypothetical protein
MKITDDVSVMVANPQGLESACFMAFGGTAEAVPFPFVTNSEFSPTAESRDFLKPIEDDGFD